jgi:hypothetical protein
VLKFKLSNIPPPDLEGSNIWRLGPYFPTLTRAAALVRDPRGGVILVGGDTVPDITTALYQLKHGGANWELMTQQLKVANFYHVAFVIPDNLVSNCTLI